MFRPQHFRLAALCRRHLAVPMPPPLLPELQRRPRPRLARFSSSAQSDRQAAEAFIVERGYSREIAAGICDALAAPGSGVPPGAMLKMATAMAGRWEVGEDAGLHALAKSVEQEVARSSGRTLVRFTVRPSGGPAFACEGFEGMSLKDIAEFGSGEGAELLREYIECACSGVMACSTCQVYVHPDWFPRVGPPGEAELDMLELAHEPEETSRLGCQVRLTPDMDGMSISIPSGANNMFDSIPFE